MEVEEGSSEIKIIADEDTIKAPVHLHASEANFCFPNSSSERTLIQSLGTAPHIFYCTIEYVY